MELNTIFTITGTGPREYNADTLDVLLIDRLMQLKKRAEELGKTAVVLSGGAKGYDAALVETAKGLNIPTFILFPNPSYPNYYWLGLGGSEERPNPNTADEAGLRKMCEGATVLPPATKYVYVYGKDGSRKHANFYRNEVMIDRADVVLVGAVNRQSAMRSPGTAQAVVYAENSEKEILYLKDEEPAVAQLSAASTAAAFNPWAAQQQGPIPF